jgi:hypothetical protein
MCRVVHVSSQSCCAACGCAIMVLRKVGYGVFVGNKEEDNKNDKDEESKVSCAKARHRESGSVVAMQNRETSTVHCWM